MSFGGTTGRRNTVPLVDDACERSVKQNTAMCPYKLFINNLYVNQVSLRRGSLPGLSSRALAVGQVSEWSAISAVHRLRQPVKKAPVSPRAPWFPPPNVAEKGSACATRPALKSHPVVVTVRRYDAAFAPYEILFLPTRLRNFRVLCRRPSAGRWIPISDG